MYMYLVQPRNNRQLCITTLRNICGRQIDPKISHIHVTRAVRTHPLERLPESKNGLLHVYDGSNLEPATRRQWTTYLYAAGEPQMPFVMVPKITNCHPVGVHCLGLCQTQIWHDNFFLKRAVFQKIIFFYFYNSDYILPMPKRWVKHVPVAVHMSDKNSHKHCLVGAHK